MTLPGPTARRTLDNNLAAAYSELSVRAAHSGQLEEALACQWASDTHKLTASLWSKASNSTDPVSAFFALATRAGRTALTATLGEAKHPAGALSVARAAWASAARDLNIPLVFHPATHLNVPGTVDMHGAGQALTDGLSAGEYLQQRKADLPDSTGAQGARVAVRAYLAQVCEQTGEHARTTAVAAWALMVSKGISSDDLAVVLATAREVLGPVGWVRAGPYLEYVGAIEMAKD